MRASFLLLLAALMAGPGYAQRHRLGEVNAEKPDGQLLQQIGQEADETKKLALLEQFAAEYPKHEALGWVYEQAQTAYMKANQPDKALETGEKLLALDPQHVEAAHQNLKAAEMKKDPDLIRKWAGVTSEAAVKVAALPKPADEEEAEAWKARTDYATQVNTYTEYALYAAALQSADAAQRIALIEALEQQNPKSEYLPKTQHQLFLAYRQSGAADKALALAEKVVATDASNEDMLLVLADNALQKKEPEKVHSYSSKLVELMESKPKPEGVSDADWQNRRNTLVGLAHFMSGKQYYNQGRFPQADKSLRAALPLVQDNAALKPEVLYLLAFANYKMEKIQDAADFYKACAAIKSPFQALANRNLAAIKTQYRGVK